MPTRMTVTPRLFHRRRALLIAAAGLTVVALLVAVLVVLPSDDADGIQQVEAPPGIPQIVFAEFSAASDLVYIAPANDPDARVLIDEIEHALGWGMNPAPEMAGSRFAYTVLPPAANGRQDTPAEVWVMDTATLDRTRLARDADLLVAPRFTSDGGALVYRRSSGGQLELVRIELATSTREVIHAERTTFGIFPIGYSADGGLVYARLSSSGTDILSVREGHSPTLLFHASDDIARDWQIAPDGRHIAYLTVEEALESILHRARVSRLGSGEPLPLSRVEETLGEQYGPTWTLDGSSLAVGQQATPEGPGRVIVTSLDGSATTLPAPEQGFDVPTAWSPDGRFLAARTFTGVNSAHPGEESVVILDAEGDRYPVISTTEIIFIGWIAGA